MVELPAGLEAEPVVGLLSMLLGNLTGNPQHLEDGAELLTRHAHRTAAELLEHQAEPDQEPAA